MWPNREMTPIHPDHEDKYAWFRLHLKLAPNHAPEALLIELPVTQSTLEVRNTGPGADVYANGKLILPEGPHPDETFNYQQISRLYNLNIPASDTSLTLAIRTLYIPFGLRDIPISSITGHSRSVIPRTWSENSNYGR